MFTVSEENTVKCLGFLRTSSAMVGPRLFSSHETVRTFGFVFSHEVPTDVLTVQNITEKKTILKKEA